MASRIWKSLLPLCFLGAPLLTAAAPVQTVSAFPLAGTLAGVVRDALGKPQMGAVVTLFDGRDRQCLRVVTSDVGAFSFGDLLPDFYSVRVTLSSFLPAIRDQIQVQPGMRRFLDVSLSTLFSTIQLADPNTARRGLMNDDWKWAVRSAGSMRPVLRILPAPSNSAHYGPVFTETKGLVRLSGGDSGTDAASEEGDFGTAFAFSTSLYDANQLQFSGNLGYTSSSGLPSASLRASYSRSFMGSTPEVSVTMRQLSLPVANGSDARLRTGTLSFADKEQVSEFVDLEYGLDADSISYIDHVNYLSPYARLSYHRKNTKVDLTYTSGNPQSGLGRSAPADDLERSVSAVLRVPRISLQNGRERVQRGENYELGITHTEGSREYRVSAYRESVSNAAVTVSGTGTAGFSGDLLTDLFSNTAVFNAGSFQTLGYTASVTQNLADSYKFTLLYTNAGVLVASADSAPVSTAADFRSAFQCARRTFVTMQAAGKVPVTGTRFTAVYQWTDGPIATSAHSYSTDEIHADPGLRVYIRQPLPSLFGLPGRMEITGDLRNILAQGYVPFVLTNGQQLLVVRTPRSIRGGVSFTF